MKISSTKCGGFTLIEVVICMAILSIVSIGLYDGCVIIAKQIELGRQKQIAALEGKKIIEEMQADSFEVPNGTSLDIGNNIKFQQQGNNGDTFYIRYLDKDYGGGNGDVSNYKYVEKVTLTPTKSFSTDSQTTGQNVEVNTDDGSHLEDNRIYISKINSQDYINYWEYNNSQQYDPSRDNSAVPIPANNGKIEMSVFFSTLTSGNQNGNQKIDINDYQGQNLLSITKEDKEDKNLNIDFSNYLDSNGLVPTNADIELDIYNKTQDTPEIYIEKPEELNVNTQVRKGQINIYDNRAENPDESNFGGLYDIKLEISDYSKYMSGEITSDNDNLFTGYYKKNIK